MEEREQEDKTKTATEGRMEQKSNRSEPDYFFYNQRRRGLQKKNLLPKNSRNNIDEVECKEDDDDDGDFTPKRSLIQGSSYFVW